MLGRLRAPGCSHARPFPRAYRGGVIASSRRLADIGAEAALVTGGGRAILLQLANPAIGHAIARHSDFERDPLKRLRHTLTFVYALVYGSDAQRTRAIGYVNGAHKPVASSDHESPSYRATDPELQLWVAATLYDTATQVHQLLIGALTDAELDAIYADYAIVGTALQVDPSMWPRTRADFDTYWNTSLARLSVDDTVLDVARALLYPTSGPLWLRAGMPLGRLVTAGLLPAGLRAAFEMPWDARRERRFRIAVRMLWFANLVLPIRIREWPKNFLLERL